MRFNGVTAAWLLHLLLFGAGMMLFASDAAAQTEPAEGNAVPDRGPRSLYADDDIQIDIPPGFAICKGQNAILGSRISGGTPPYTYSWEPSTGLSAANIRNPVASPETSTVYRLTVTDSDGNSKVSDPLPITVFPIPDATFQGPTQVCVGDVVRYTFFPQPGDFFTWRFTGLPLTPIAAGDGTIAVRWDGLGKATVTLYIQNWLTGCVDSTEVEVTVGEKPDVKITASGPLQFCPGGSVELDAGPGYHSYRWSTGETTRRITVDRSGSYSVNVTREGFCDGRSAVVITVENPEPKVVPSGTVKLCSDESVTLRAPDGYAQYRWSTGATSQSITTSIPGSYFVTVTDAAGCTGTSPPTVVKLLDPPAEPVISAAGAELTSSEAFSYQWLLDGNPLTGAVNRTFTATVSGTYAVQTFDTNGCTALSAPVRVFIGSGRSYTVRLDTVSATVGERTALTFYIDPPLSSLDNITGFRAVLSMSATALFPHDMRDADGMPNAGTLSRENDGRVAVELQSPLPIESQHILGSLELEGLITGQPVNKVTLEEFELYGGTASIAGNGLVLLSGCRIGGTYGKRIRVRQILPNPVGSEATVLYQAPMDVRPNLRLVDPSGRTVLSELLPPGNGEEQRFLLRTDHLPSGIYLVELIDGAEASAATIIITH